MTAELPITFANVSLSSGFMPGLALSSNGAALICLMPKGAGSAWDFIRGFGGEDFQFETTLLNPAQISDQPYGIGMYRCLAPAQGELTEKLYSVIDVRYPILTFSSVELI